MGDPKKPRKKFESPRFPWQPDILRSELNLIGQYGLRNKRELWRYKTMLSKFRGNARSILGMTTEERVEKDKQLINRLRQLKILHERAGLDEILDLSIEDILERRLQTLVFRRNMSNSIHQARQLIVHGHVAIAGKKVSSPSYLVLRNEEEEIKYAPISPLSKPEHPLRKTFSTTFETKGT